MLPQVGTSHRWLLQPNPFPSTFRDRTLTAGIKLAPRNTVENVLAADANYVPRARWGKVCFEVDVPDVQLHLGPLEEEDGRGKPTMSAFEEHKEELEKFEQMFGRERGRLAVSLDRLTNALVLVGQHGVYCTSARNPMVPA